MRPDEGMSAAGSAAEPEVRVTKPGSPDGVPESASGTPSMGCWLIGCVVRSSVVGALVPGTTRVVRPVARART